jgi:hypothetical protein
VPAQGAVTNIAREKQIGADAKKARAGYAKYGSEGSFGSP